MYNKKKMILMAGMLFGVLLMIPLSYISATVVVWEDCTMKDIVKFLNTIPSTATRRVDKLVKNGFVDRKVAENDRRLVKLVLTPKGEDLYTSFIENRMRGLTKMLGKFDRLDLEAFFRVINGLSQRKE